MALETGTYPSDFVTTNPASGDPVSQADDHIRLVKSTLQASFPDASSGPIYGLRAKTATASTSGTSIDFTSIPSWAKRITISLAGVSTNGTSPLIVQIGDSGGIETSGYLGSASNLQDSIAISATNFTSGVGLVASFSAASVYHGVTVLTLLDSATNTWVASSLGAASFGASTFNGASSKSLSATLDRVRLTTSGGVNTFDAGLVNILFE